jgi:hypothetical protein
VRSFVGRHAEAGRLEDLVTQVLDPAGTAGVLMPVVLVGVSTGIG